MDSELSIPCRGQRNQRNQRDQIDQRNQMNQRDERDSRSAGRDLARGRREAVARPTGRRQPTWRSSGEGNNHSIQPTRAWKSVKQTEKVLTPFASRAPCYSVAPSNTGEQASHTSEIARTMVLSCVAGHVSYGNEQPISNSRLEWRWVSAS